MIGLSGVRGLLVALVTSLASCTQVSDRERFDEEGGLLSILRTVPGAGAVEVAAKGEIDLCMSALVDPRSIAEGDATISSGQATVDSELSIQLVAWTAPGGEAVPAESEAPWCTGSVLTVAPKEALTAGALYRLQMRPTLRGWAGERLETDAPGWVDRDGDPRFFLEFTVDATPDGGGILPGEDPPVPSGPTLTDLFGPGAPFDPELDNCSCHRGDDPLAIARLDLSDPASAFEGLLGRTGELDTGFSMVVPRDPSESFLMHKLLRDAGGERLHGILGDAMPPDGRLAYQDLVAIALWIQSGALP